MEKKLVWESCLKYDSWGLLEMHILLTDDIVEFGMRDVEMMREVKMSKVIDIKLPYRQHEDLVLRFLMSRCPVSNTNNFLL